MPTFVIQNLDAAGKSHTSHVHADEIEEFAEGPPRTMAVVLKREGRQVGKYLSVTGYHEIEDDPWSGPTAQDITNR